MISPVFMQRHPMAQQEVVTDNRHRVQEVVAQVHIRDLSARLHHTPLWFIERLYATRQ